MVAARWYYLRQSQALDAYVSSALSAIADTKAKQVANWRTERLGDGDVLKSTAVMDLARRVLSQRASSAADRTELLDVMQRTISAFHYAGGALVDREGRALLQIGAMNVDPDRLRQLAAAASAAGRVMLSDLSARSDSGPPWMSLTVPVDGAGAIILDIDPGTFLYPYLRAWPTVSRTGETLLLRREGEGIIYLNEGRSGRSLTFHRREVPRLSLSLPKPGAGRLLKWTDYRGVAVMGVMQEVPGSPWYLSAKVDVAEVSEPLRWLAWEMALLLVLIAAGNAAAAGMIWRGRQLRIYRDSELWFRQIANETPALLWTMTAEMQTPFVNRELARFLGMDSDRFGNDWGKYIHPEDRERVLELFDRQRAAEREYRDEFRLMRLDGQARWVVAHALPKRGLNGEFAGYAGSMTDVTEQREAALHMRDANAALALELRQRTRSERAVQALTARLIRAQEEERARLARELHDDLSQQLAAVSIATSNLKKKIPVGADEAVVQSSRIQQKLVHMAECIRRLSHQLHPSVLEHSGLAPALGNYCEEYAALTSHRISFRCDTFRASVPPAVALCVYRVTQEALQNAVKHSRVNEAEVALEYGEWGLRLTVSDRGVGIDPEAPPSDGLGMVSIKERTRLVNGIVEVRSRPGNGTVLTLTIPLPAQSQGEIDASPNRMSA
ncbi:MAG TPA: PAS domain S-box protein [Candidatus Acidoferrum sp.]|nr:PAS domain S-box protein [Candidatus Acidoferrum sp.]